MRRFPLSLNSFITLANAVTMPRLGLGTYRSEEGAEVENAVRIALEVGYRSFDTASFYGNEAGVGRAIRDSGLSRAEVFVTTKVWNDEQSYEGTLAALDRSLSRLGMDHVDLYLVHWPIPELSSETWRAMEEALAAGRTRAIGVCNHLLHHLRPLLESARVPPMVNQFEHHPRLQQTTLVAFCKERCVEPMAWAPLARGGVFEIPELVSIGDRHGKNAAQVTLRWMMQRGIAAIPKSVREERIRANADIFDFELDDGEMRVIAGLDRGERVGPDPDIFVG